MFEGIGDRQPRFQHGPKYAVIRPDTNWPQNRPVLGGAAIRSFIGDLMATLGTGELELISMEAIDAGDRVVTRFRARVHGHLSGIEDEVTFTNVHIYVASGRHLEYLLDPQGVGLVGNATPAAPHVRPLAMSFKSARR